MTIHHLIFDPAGDFLTDLQVFALMSMFSGLTIEVHIHDARDISRFVKVFLPPK